MRNVDGRLVLSATDLTGFLACEHLAVLERDAAEQGSARPVRIDAQLELLRRHGDEHEQSYLAHLRAQGNSVIEIARETGGIEGLLDLEARTVAAMREGHDYIYQAGFFDGRWHGRADFLRRVDKPSRLGGWSYEVEDTKLARSLKVAALIQMADYARHVARVQGAMPERVHAVLGNRIVESRSLADVFAYYETARGRFERFIDASNRGTTYPDPVDHCGVCRWDDVCQAKRRSDDHLSLVAGAHRRQVRRLQEAGVHTVVDLAERADPVAHLTDTALARLRTQASLQVSRRVAGVLSHQLIHPQASNQGLGLLPEPCDGDLFFDIEGDGLVGEHGLEYLFGVLAHDGGTSHYAAFWGHDPGAERRAFEQFIDFVMERLRRHPGLHVYHYSQYEPSALKRLAGRYATREDDLDRLLRGKVLVDLYAVVRSALLASTESYSLKALEPFYMGRRTDRIRDAGSSMVEYERWLDCHDPKILRDIADYNETDCRSTSLLRDWLESMRVEYAATFGVEVERPQSRDPEPSEDNAALTAATEALAQRLVAAIPDDPHARDPEQRARLLLAGTLDWHRREARPQWWEYFARLEMDSEQLREDAHAVAGLEPEGVPVQDGKALLQTYAFDAGQESRIDAGDRWIDPATGKQAGEVIRIDRSGGRLELRRTPAERARGHPRALVPPGPRASNEQRMALRRLGEWVADHGVAGPGRYRAARDLLIGRPPRLPGAREGEALQLRAETDSEAAIRITLALDAGCLPIQGPPGSGKTYAAANIALRLAREAPRRRVGVTALSHRAITHLLTEICGLAGNDERPVRIVQKADAGQACNAPQVRCITQPSQVAVALAEDDVDIVAGTAWLFSREDMAGAVDTLIVDEASQVSLADVLAMAGAARNLVLCGDPQQLSQPTKGTHPEGAERSALEHVLGGTHTIAPDKGLFLGVTRRMHPELCAVISDVFYDGRLSAEPRCANQSVATSVPGLDGAGLRFLPVEHTGNGVKSSEEADVVDALARLLLSGSWTDAQGVRRPLTPHDLVVLAPYNAQVTTIASLLPAQIRAGTVDRFQGQEAAVAIYSMATSSGEDQRRGMDFLYSLNRLDVALSRARAIAILVCSPELTHVHCRTVDQLLLANALCRLVGRATALRLPGLQHEMLFTPAHL